MQKKVAQKVLELTRECLMHYWKLDPEHCRSSLLWERKQ